MKKIMIFLNKSILPFIFCSLFVPFVFADVINLPGTEPPVAKERVFSNRSILSCGPRRTATVLTYVDVKALLAISNHFSQTKVSFTTDWQNLNTPKINLNKISSNIPEDIVRVLFLCLNWEDTQIGNLYNVPQEELNEYVNQTKLEKPWKIYNTKLQTQIEQLPESEIEKLVHMVLRAEQNEKSQGPLEDNTSVKSVTFTWLL